jgi:hypothetical protein
MSENNKITCTNHVYNEQYNEQCQYITNSNNINSPSGHCHVLEPFDCSYMYQNPIRGTRLSKTDYPYFCRISFENRSRDMNISSPHTCIFQRKAFSECFCHDSNNDSDNVFRRTNNPRKGSWLLWHFQSLFYNPEHYIQNTYNEFRTRTFAMSASSGYFINEAHERKMPNWSTIYLPLVVC